MKVNEEKIGGRSEHKIDFSNGRHFFADTNAKVSNAYDGGGTTSTP